MSHFYETLLQNGSQPMAYIKKPEFGSARIKASNITFKGSSPSTRLQNGNSIIVDGKPLKGEKINVKQLYETLQK